MTEPSKAFQDIMGKLPERDQGVLLRQHGVTSLSKLMDKKLKFQQRQFEDICSDVQMVLEVVCTYLESLDDIGSFTWEGFENFCEYIDNSGDYQFEMKAEEVKKMAAGSKEDADPMGFNLTAEERKQMEDQVENDPLTMKIRGFSARSLQWETEENAKNLEEDASEKFQVAFNGSVYYVNKCYHYQQGNGNKVVVGIRKFTKVRENLPNFVPLCQYDSPTI
jgi:hypothetical protein